MTLLCGITGSPRLLGVTTGTGARAVSTRPARSLGRSGRGSCRSCCCDHDTSRDMTCDVNVACPRPWGHTNQRGGEPRGMTRSTLVGCFGDLLAELARRLRRPGLVAEPPAARRPGPGRPMARRHGAATGPRGQPLRRGRAGPARGARRPRRRRPRHGDARRARPRPRRARPRREPAAGPASRCAPPTPGMPACMRTCRRPTSSSSAGCWATSPTPTSSTPSPPCRRSARPVPASSGRGRAGRRT